MGRDPRLLLQPHKNQSNKKKESRPQSGSQLPTNAVESRAEQGGKASFPFLFCLVYPKAASAFFKAFLVTLGSVPSGSGPEGVGVWE